MQTTIQETTTHTTAHDIHPTATYQKKKAIFRTYQVVWYVLGVVEVLLLFRIILKMLAANPASAFVSFIYTVSNPFALPFAGIFGVSVDRGNVIEWSSFVAMAVYFIVAYGIVQLMQLVKPTNPEEVSASVDNKEPLA